MQAIRVRTAWLKGPAFHCEVAPPKVRRAWRLVLLGAPGVGKGTQAALLTERLKACHLSTGDVFRAAKSLNETERSHAMNEALEYMRRGDLVPDTIVLDMVRERLQCLRCRSGFLLDGFPRTLAQARALQEMLEEENLKLDGVISYELPIPEIVRRLSGRRTCPKCQAVYHVTEQAPKKEGICDKCGAALIQREDDLPDNIRVRMAAYETSTAPLVKFYRELGLLVPVQATSTPEGTYERTMLALRTARD